MAVAEQDVRRVIAKYTNLWNLAHHNDPLWVVGALSGQPLNIPGTQMWNGGKHAGMHLSIRAQLIAINPAMNLESQLASFLHELGHCYFNEQNAGANNEIESDAFAIRYSLERLSAEGYGDVASAECRAILSMTDQPYVIAVDLLKADPIWNQFLPKV